MHIRITPSFVVASLALLVAVGGTSYAAGKVTSSQIKNNTVQSKDIKDGSLQGQDIKDGSLQGQDLKDRTVTGAEIADRSLPRTKIETKCAAGEVPISGGCTKKTAYASKLVDVEEGTQTVYLDAAADCHKRNGRLPTLDELEWIRRNPDQFAWANGNPGNYEYSSTYYIGNGIHTPVAIDGSGFLIYNAYGQSFWYHCITG